MAAARFRWWVLANVVLVNVIVTGIAWNYVIMFVPELVADLGLGMADWGGLWAGIPLGVLLCSLPAGAAGDRFGMRGALAAGLALSGAALLLRGEATGFATLWLSMFGFGAGLSLVMANFPKALGEWFPSAELGLANGVSQAGVGLGLGAATLAAPRLADALGGWRGWSTSLGIAALGLAALWWLTVHSPAGTSNRDETTGAIAAMRRALSVRAVRGLALCYALYMGGYLGSIGYIPTHLTEAGGLSPAAAGATLSLGPWLFTLGSVVLPGLSDRVGRRRAVYLPGMLAGALALAAAAALTGTGDATAIGLAIAGIGFGTGAVALLFAIPVESEGVGEALAGSAVGAITAAGFVGGFLSSVVGMALVARSPVLGFAFWTLCLAAAALAIAWVPETGRAQGDA